MMFFVHLLYSNCMKKSTFILALLLFLPSAYLTAQNNQEDFTIYLIRHSEKDLLSDNQIDPPLTKCGAKRSVFLRDFFKEITVDKIYSTNYLRTKNTAKPIALSKNLDIKYYDPSDLKSFSELLINSKQNILVVGHSNTTPVLAGLLDGEEKAPFDESIYNRIYKISFNGDETKLFMIETPFKCK